MTPPRRNHVACDVYETILVSSSGDVLTCRDRKNSYSAVLCSTCEPKHLCLPTSAGLLGGAEVLTPVRNIRQQRRNKVAPSTPKSNGSINGSSNNHDNNNHDNIDLMQSFDYSHDFDMIPISKVKTNYAHGIPMFHKQFCNIKIQTVSAHGSGSHVLLISDNSLLYSYGNNEHGQLGIGTASKLVEYPTIVTPLVEHGGKAILCAAGIDYSLVVVETEESRLKKSSRDGQQMIHQVYGFGNNQNSKLGLVSEHDESVRLPRRVHLQCQARHDSGMVELVADENRSAAIVASDATTRVLYTWGSAPDYPATPTIQETTASPIRVALTPSKQYIVSDNGCCTVDDDNEPLLDNVSSISSCSAQTLVCTTAGEAYTWTDQATTPIPVSLPERVVDVCVGCDCRFFVGESGTVYSSGSPSGRLGQSNVIKAVSEPAPMFGGLRLWKKRAEVVDT